MNPLGLTRLPGRLTPGALVVLAVAFGPWPSAQAGCDDHARLAVLDGAAGALIDFHALDPDSGPPPPKPCSGWSCSDRSTPIPASVVPTVWRGQDLSNSILPTPPIPCIAPPHVAGEAAVHPIAHASSLERPPRQSS